MRPHDAKSGSFAGDIAVRSTPVAVLNLAGNAAIVLDHESRQVSSLMKPPAWVLLFVLQLAGAVQAEPMKVLTPRVFAPLTSFAPFIRLPSEDMPTRMIVKPICPSPVPKS